MRAVDALRDLDGVRAAVLLDDQQQPGPAVDDALAPERLVVLDDAADVGHPQHAVAALGDRHLREIRRALDRLDVLDVQPPVAVLDEAALADGEALGVLQHAGVERLRAGLMTWSIEMP